MKTFLTAGLLAVTSLTSVAALAESGIGETWGQDVVSSGPGLTRAQVVAELREARANNTITYDEAWTPNTNVQKSPSNLTRRQVTDEDAALRAAGKLPAYED